MPDMVAKTFEFYKNQQNEFLKHLNTKDVNPFLDETTNEAVKDWQSKQFQIMNNFFNSWQKSGTDKSSEDKESSLSEKDEIEILKRQMSELKEELNKKK